MYSIKCIHRYSLVHAHKHTYSVLHVHVYYGCYIGDLTLVIGRNIQYVLLTPMPWFWKYKILKGSQQWEEYIYMISFPLINYYSKEVYILTYP